MSLSEQKYSKIRRLVYCVDKKHEDYKSYLKESSNIKVNYDRYEVFKIEDN